MDLELATTQELIKELLRRRKFLGVVIHAEDDYRGDRWTGARVFKVHYNGNLDGPRVRRLLHAVIDHVERRDE